MTARPGLAGWLIASVTLVTLLGATGVTGAPIRIATWNITNYAGGQDADVESAVYALFSGRCLCPDVLVCQEFINLFAVNDFVSILNNAPGSPGDWAAAAFVDGADTDSAFFYRTGEIALATDLSANGVTTVSVGSGAPNHPRNVMRYDIRPAALISPESTIAIYSTHMKAGSTGTDQSRRLVEAVIIRDDAELLPTGWNFILAGDYNIQQSSQAAYQELVGSQVNNDGRFFDPINSAGNWQNNSGFRYVHTQDPATQMDDRYDIILVSGSLIDGTDFEYDGNSAIPFSVSTWNDPNHSYRAWGNDGTSYNTTLTTTGNVMVGATIAQALIDLASGGGHVPVYAEFTPPANDLGACCTPCGCNDLLNEAQCLAEDGFFYGIGVECGSEDPTCTIPNNLRINEVRVSHDGAPEREEFIEIVGDPDQPLCGLSLVAIEGELSSKGRVDLVWPLDDCGGGDVCTCGVTGYFVTGGTDLSPDLVLFGGENVLENGTQTILLLRDTQLSSGDDVDANNDGVADISPALVGTILDAVGVVDGGFFQPSPDRVYYDAAPVGPATDDTVGAGAARCPDASDTDSHNDWVQISANLTGLPECVTGTPGTENPNHCGGDDDDDLDIDLRDFAAFQRCFGQSSAACVHFDLDGDCTVGLGDVDRFRTRLELSGP